MQRKVSQKHSKIKFLKKGPIYRSLFRNGLTFLFHEAQGFSGARININILAGSFFEKSEEQGMAHLLEHLIFKEGKTTYLKKLEGAGAEINAYTYKENICFELGSLTDKVEDLFPDFFNLVFNLDFSDEQFDKEKKIVIQELREDADDHESAGLEFVFEKNFEMGLGHPIGGSEKSVNSFTSESVRAYFEKHFTPEKIIISVIAGSDFRKSLEKEIKRQVEERFGEQVKNPFRLRTKKTPLKIKTFSSTLKRQVESSILFLSFQGPSISMDHYYDYVVLDDLLFEGLSSKFFIKFREENAYVYGLGSSLNPFHNTGNYLMVFNSQKAHLSKIEAGVREVLKDLSDNPLDANRVKSIKSRIMDNWKIGLDSLEERIELIQDNEMYGLDEFSDNALKQKLDQVTSKTVQKLCKKLYTEQSSILKIVSKD